MKFLLNSTKSLSKLDKAIWVLSVTIITLSFILMNNNNYLTLIASIIGATALIFVAKGNVIGQFLTVVFSIFYGFISLSFNYYGEMITYLGMTTPIAIISIITWIKNPYENNKCEVKIKILKFKEYLFVLFIGLFITFVFYFILKYFNTTNLVLSTISIFTSFVASYLTMQRSEYYAIAYSLNDIILIALWILASINDITYFPMIICFVIFLINDLYGFINWSKTRRHQN